MLSPLHLVLAGELLDPKVEDRLRTVVEALVDWAMFLQTRQ